MEGFKSELKWVAMVAGLGGVAGAVVVYRFGASLAVLMLLVALALVGLTVLRRQGVDFLAMTVAIVATVYVLTNIYIAGVVGIVVVLTGFFGRQAINRQQRSQPQQGQQAQGEDQEEGGVNVQTTVKGLNRGLVDPDFMKSLVDRGGATGELAELVVQAELAGMAVRRGVNPARVAQILSGGESAQDEEGQPTQVVEPRVGVAKGVFGGRRRDG